MLRTVLFSLSFAVFSQGALAGPTGEAAPIKPRLSTLYSDPAPNVGRSTVPADVLIAAPAEEVLWNDVLAFPGQSTSQVGGTPIHIPSDCSTSSTVGQANGPCTSVSNPASAGGSNGVPAPGGLLLIAAAFGFAWRRLR